MEKIFDQICEVLFSKLQNGEYLTVNFGGEKSQFIRVNSAKVRQTGLIDDADLSLELIHNNRVCHCSITVHEPFEVMKDEAMDDGTTARMSENHFVMTTTTANEIGRAHV